MSKEAVCHDCGNKYFIFGLEGGASQNVLCSNCFTEYQTIHFKLEKIGKPSFDRLKDIYGVEIKGGR